ncbi:MAG: DUF4253 domain-containing protein [Longimicrobiaceae bacterium]
MSFFRRLFGRGEAGSAAPAHPDFPFPLYAVPGARALDELERLRELGRAEGFTAVLLGEEANLAPLAEGIRNAGSSPAEIVAAAADVDVARWLEDRAADDPEQYEAEAGSWDDEVEPTGITLHRDPLGRFHGTVYIARIPTARSWEVPAYLNLGGWNECPPAAAQVALSSDWNGKYGAEIVAVGPDVVQYRVSRPPADRASAERLAVEQFRYCSDIVHQGTGTLRGLALALLGSDTWFFWWD